MCCHWLRDSYLLRSFSTEGRQTGGRETLGTGVRGTATGGQGQRCGMGLRRMVEEENSGEKYNDTVVDGTMKSIIVHANAET